MSPSPDDKRAIDNNDFLSKLPKKTWKDGDWHWFVSATQELLVRAARRLTGNCADAEDVAQETYIEVAQLIVTNRWADVLQQNSDAIWARILQILRRNAIDLYRKRRVRPERTGQEMAINASYQVDSTAVEAAARQEFEDFLKQLHPEDRQLLELYLATGGSVVAVAERLGISLSAAQQRWKRLMARLKGRFKNSA